MIPRSGCWIDTHLPRSGSLAVAFVYLKAGGSTVDPVGALRDDRYVTLNLDKGSQSEGGRDLGLIGSIWNGTECPQSEWRMLRRKYDHPTPITASPVGELWIALGTDSGYESVTGVYYHSIGGEVDTRVIAADRATVCGAAAARV